MGSGGTSLPAGCWRAPLSNSPLQQTAPWGDATWKSFADRVPSGHGHAARLERVPNLIGAAAERQYVGLTS